VLADGKEASCKAVTVFITLLFWGWLWARGVAAGCADRDGDKRRCARVEDLQPIATLVGAKQPVNGSAIPRRFVMLRRSRVPWIGLRRRRPGSWPIRSYWR
jgi:hypothetical protein